MKKTYLIVSVISSILLSSCAEMQEMVMALSSSAIQYMNTADAQAGEKDYKFSTDERLKGIIRLTEVSCTGSGGQALATTKVVGDILFDFTGKDATKFDTFLDNSMNGLIANQYAKSDNDMNLIGAGLSVLEHGIYLTEDLAKQKKAEELIQYYDSYTNPKSKNYDPFFKCKYELKITKDSDYNTTRAEWIIIKDEKRMLDCMRQTEMELANQDFEDYTKQKIGTAMSYDEFVNLPDSEKPDISDYFSNSKELITIESNQNPILSDANIIDSEKDDEKIYLQNEPHQDNSDINDLDLLEQVKIDKFEFDSYQLSDSNKEILNKVVEILNKHPEVELELLGHTCNIGDTQTNYTIGIIRAKKVKQFLVENGVETQRIYVHSMGSKHPLVSNNSEYNRLRNRRVEIKLIK